MYNTVHLAAHAAESFLFILLEGRENNVRWELGPPPKVELRVGAPLQQGEDARREVFWNPAAFSIVRKHGGGCARTGPSTLWPPCLYSPLWETIMH